MVKENRKIKGGVNGCLAMPNNRYEKGDMNLRLLEIRIIGDVVSTDLLNLFVSKFIVQGTNSQI